ncbi:GNAT family N-acetyltransferase [Paeniglutamicibacter sulfureus]|uniref:Ribosomal protein S18 acetylase RimI-like enzyme n=1 Tax=Paeniglutamicibacter sulfureus TaxID=43666 RepID=A0ABU2BJS5_9MICC|nr:GNAT family N-acetyltransferase [Paeniglutamicibacter sulfureus]MDR7358899.1 ribosomal protein S18 acetylase RimI-like enzyme [Paeniglutamicibacter sulfureus]
MSQKPPKFPSTRSLVVVREATEEDLRLMASDVIRYLPEGLFPRLGKRFVRRWMKTFLTEQYGVALVAVTKDAPRQQVGFLVGSTNQIHHVADVLHQHKWGLLFSGLAALSIRPRVLLHFLRTRARPYLRRLLGRTNGPVAGANPRPATAVITSLVVLPTLRGGGIGRLLVEEFLNRAVADRASLAELVTAAGAAGAGAFYKKLGWTCVGERHSKDGAPIHTYQRSLP